MPKKIYADIILLGVAAVWGTTFVVVQKAIEFLPPYSFLFVRFFVAFLFLLSIILIKKGIRKEKSEETSFIPMKTLVSGSMLAIWLFAGYAFQTIGLVYTTSSKAGFITGLSVVLVPIFSFILLKIKPKAPAIVGVVLASIGLYFLTFGDSTVKKSGALIGNSMTLNLGDVLVFFCAISFALQIVYTGRYATKHDTLKLTLVQLGVVSLLNFLFAVVYEDLSLLFSAKVLLNPYMIFAIVITSLFGTALAFLAQTHFQRYTTPTRVALIFAMEPIFAAITGVWVANEVLSSTVILGSILIFLGMILAELPSDLLLRSLKVKKN